MDSRAVLTILLRLLAILLGLWVGLLEALWLPQALSTHSANAPEFIAVAIATLLLVVILWGFASRLARLLLPASQRASAVARSTVEEFTRAALCVLGVWYIVETFSSIPYFMLFGLEVSHGKDEAISRAIILAPICNLAVGIALLVFASRIARRICIGTGVPPSSYAP